VDQKILQSRELTGVNAGRKKHIWNQGGGIPIFSGIVKHLAIVIERQKMAALE
jgi:hypothetical protein